jgi:predicted AAA+ superfamily ATPase
MFRKALNDLREWKNAPSRKPLIIRGARQVGKTWLMKEFGKTQFKQVAYINFDANAPMKNLFAGDFDIKRLLTGLQIEAKCAIDPQNTLLIFDEIQETPQAIASLKYFYEQAPEYHIIAAGSLLGVALAGTSFPVGKVDFFDLYPLSFSEFLQALGQDDLLQLQNNVDWPLLATFKDKFITLLKQYYFVGGMPEAVFAFTQQNDFSKVRDIQKNILLAYEQDFSKHVPANTVTKLRMIWNAIPAQLSKEHRKFIYGLLRQGARAREFELALTWLCDYGLATKVHRITKPAIPIKAYEDLSSFKLFMLDVGLLGALSDLDAQVLLEGHQLFEEFKGALSEQFVFGELRNLKNTPLAYWSAEKSTAEIDFVIQKEGQVIPIEVKATDNLQAKSLKSYKQNYQPKTSIRTSLADYRDEGWLKNIPLYCLGIDFKKLI